jgi:hypothetical protein
VKDPAYSITRPEGKRKKPIRKAKELLSGQANNWDRMALARLQLQWLFLFQEGKNGEDVDDLSRAVHGVP